MNEKPQSVGHVSGPHFFVNREEYTGKGWVVGASNVLFGDGSHSVHTHYAFETEAEAHACADELREKMT